MMGKISGALVAVIAVCALACSSDEVTREIFEGTATRDLRAVVEGSCGPSLFWSLESDTNTLSISGSGIMSDFEDGNTPWKSYLSSIEHVVISEGASTIGNWAFARCTNLVSVSIPSTVTSIGYFSFYECSKLPSLVVPFGVTYIADEAFNLCRSLENVSLPESLLSIGNFSFYECNSLKSISFPSSLESIGSYSFCYCHNLTTVLIPAKVSWIGSSPFAPCNNLLSIEVNSSNSRYKSYDNCLIDDDEGRLIQCPTTKEGKFVIPDDISIIGSDCFRECENLTAVIIPPSVTSIEFNAFMKCSSLSSLDIPSSVKSIGVEAFHNCFNLNSIVIPEGVTSVSAYAFESCFNLKSVVLPSTITSIGEWAFFGCGSLTSIALPSTVTTIGESAFAQCFGLADITIPSSVSSIEPRTFEECSSLTSITIPTNVKTIGDEAFSKCSLLTDVILEAGVASIGQWAFSECSSLTSVIIPQSVKSVGLSAFENCVSLMSVSYLGTNNPGSSSNIFSTCPALSFVCVPSSYASNYFCGLTGFCKSSSCEKLQKENNQCFEVSCSGTEFGVRKREIADLWENQTNGCIKYECDNESGLLQWGTCGSSTDEEVCLNDTCVNKNSIEAGKWQVEIKIKETEASLVNTSDILSSISKLSNVDIDQVIIATEINEFGQVVKIIAYVNDEQTAKVIVEAVNELPADDDCGYGVLCRKTDARVKTRNLFLSGSSSFSVPFFSIVVSLMITGKNHF